MPRRPSFRYAAATLSLLALLHAAPPARAGDDETEAAARRVQALRDLGTSELRELDLGGALRRFDAGVERAEAAGLPDAAAALRLYRGFVLALLQREGAEADLERFAGYVADRAPELGPYAHALRDQILGLAAGDLGAIEGSLEEIGRVYRDRLPPIYFRGLELISLYREERFEEAGVLCRDILASQELAAIDPSPRSIRSLELSCSVAELLARATSTGIDDEDVLALGEELLAAVPDQPGPLQEPLRLLLEQLWAGEDEGASWISSTDFLTPATLLYSLVATAAPLDLRAGLDGLLAAMMEDLVAIESGSGDAAAAYALADLARSRAHLDGLAPEAPEGGRLPGDASARGDDLEARLLERAGLLEAKRLRFGDALRYFDAALARVEGGDRPVQEAGLYAYRGMLLALLQRFEPAQADMQRFSELAVAAAPELEPLISLTRELVLGVATWNFDRVIGELERIGEIYRDRLPPWFYDNLDLISLLREGRAAAAAGVCRKVLTAAAGAGSPPADDMLNVVAMACAAVDVVAAAEDGEVPAMELLALGGAVMRVIQDQPEPFRGALATLAGQFLRLASEPEAKELWAAGTDLRKGITPLLGLIAKGVPPEMRSGAYGALTGMIELFVDIKGDAGDPAAAYALAEEARSRELLDRLVDARLVDRGDGTAAADIAALRTRRDALEGRIRAAQAAGATTEDLDGLHEELTGVRRDLDAVFERLALRRPEVARGEPVPLDEIQRALDADTTLVSYLTFSSNLDDTLAWVVDRSRVEQVVLDIRADDLARKVSLLVEGLRRGEEVTGAAERLYRTLWAPLRDRVRTRRVLLVPHGPLQELPFAALRDPESGLWLAQQATLLHAPSASAWMRLRERAGEPAGPPLVLGTDGGGLPATAAEVRSVAALWGVRPLLGAEATEEAFRAQAPGARLVHVSSHGILDFEDPLFSRLELAPSHAGSGDPRRDGRLELHEVVNELDLAGTRLVVLPACHTGRGPRTRGDEVTNLARAFLLAGARSALTTAWAVEDAATAALMVDLHRHLAAGTEAAEALRRAQEAALATVDRSHPWYWAGFALHGAGGTLPPPAAARAASQPFTADGVHQEERPGKEVEPWR